MRKPSVYALLVCIAVMIVFFVLMERRAVTDNVAVDACMEVQSVDLVKEKYL